MSGIYSGIFFIFKAKNTLVFAPIGVPPPERLFTLIRNKSHN